MTRQISISRHEAELIVDCLESQCPNDSVAMEFTAEVRTLFGMCSLERELEIYKTPTEETMKTPPKTEEQILENNFTYHAPKGDQPQRYIEIREAAKSLAKLIHTKCPNSRERAVAITHLETAIFWANASIARNE